MATIERTMTAPAGMGMPAQASRLPRFSVRMGAKALGVVEEILHPSAGRVPLVRPPFHLSETPPTIRLAPPTLGQHTEEVLRELLELTAEDVAELKRQGTI